MRQWTVLAMALLLTTCATTRAATPGPGGLLGVAPDLNLPSATTWAFSERVTTAHGEVDLVRSWSEQAEDGVQLTVVPRKDSDYVITKVEYFWQPGTHGDLGFEPDPAQERQVRTVTDGASSFAVRATVGGAAGQHFAGAGEASHRAGWHVGARVTLSNPSAQVRSEDRNKVVEIFGRAPAALDR